MKEYIEKNRQGIIICGFAGVGKSTLAKMKANVVDLESTPFQRDWRTYARVANHMKNNGYIVLVSCHNELRTQLHNDGIEYHVVLPNQENKAVFMKRYVNRGNTDAFIKLLDENWVNFCKELPWETPLRVDTEFLSDLIPAADVVEKVERTPAIDAALEVLNFCRNQYYTESLGTEKREMADAINTIPPLFCERLCGADKKKWKDGE